ncbi:hypothetical protein PAEPH01_1239 [Pancytospora epiphaga]|nr:hypothetical protein PAEPH01_1239 [Pancytospora epiphaga]
MLLKCKLIKMLMALPIILGSQEGCSTTLAFPNDTDSDSSEVSYQATPDTDLELKLENPKVAKQATPDTDLELKLENPKVEKNSKLTLTPPATISSFDELPTVTSILKNVGFKVTCLELPDVEDKDVEDIHVFFILVKHARKVLRRSIIAIEGILSNIVKTIKILQQGVMPSESDDELISDDLLKSPSCMLLIYGEFLARKLGSHSYDPDPEGREPILITEEVEVWEKVLRVLEKINSFIENFEGKLSNKSNTVVMEPHKPNVKPKKSVHAIARILISIDRVGLVTKELAKEYYKRHKEKQSTLGTNLIGKDVDNNLFTDIYREFIKVKLLAEIGPNLSHLENMKSTVQEEMGTSRRHKSFIIGLIKDIQGELNFMIENTLSTIHPITGEKYLEYLLYSKEKLGGVVIALKRIRKELDDITVDN